MTDKQIACAYINDRLRGVVVDHYILREIAAANLTEERCYRIVERIIAMIDEIREPLVRHLNNAKLDTI